VLRLGCARYEQGYRTPLYCMSRGKQSQPWERERESEREREKEENCKGGIGNRFCAYISTCMLVLVYVHVGAYTYASSCRRSYVRLLHEAKIAVAARKQCRDHLNPPGSTGIYEQSQQNQQN